MRRNVLQKVTHRPQLHIHRILPLQFTLFPGRSASAASVVAAQLSPSPVHLIFLPINDSCVLHLVLILILVTPAPGRVATIAGALHTLLHNFLRHRLQIVRPPNLGEEIDERRRHVHPVVAELGRLVVPGEHVVIVVPSLAECERGYGLVLRWVDVAIVGTVSPFVGSAVHQPGGIQDEGPTEQRCYEPCVGPGFAPAVDRGHGG